MGSRDVGAEIEAVYRGRYGKFLAVAVATFGMSSCPRRRFIMPSSARCAIAPASANEEPS